MNIFNEIKATFNKLREYENLPPVRKKKHTKVSSLRTRIWLESILRDQKISVRQLSDTFYSDKEKTGTVDRWLKGKQSARIKSVEKIEGIYPGSSEIYKLPIFELLEVNLPKVRLKKLSNKFKTKYPLIPWNFPKNSFDDREFPTIAIRGDSDGLFEWGGFNGFLAILILLREAEFNNDVLKHEIYMKAAYKAFPSFCRDRRFIKRWEEFLEALEALNACVYSTYRYLAPNKDIIKKQIFSKEHQTVRALRPRSLKNGRFIELETPYIEAKFLT